MNKYALLIWGFIYALNVHSQPTITSFNAPSVSDIISYDKAQSTNWNEGSAGANVTWDFSSYTLIPYNTWHYKDATHHPAYNNYPSANLVIEIAQNMFEFLKTNTDSYDYIGFYRQNNVESIYSDPWEVMVFPMTYQDVKNETFAANVYSSNDTISRTGSVTYEADGYGTLILPNKTYNDVLRIKTTYHAVEEKDGDLKLTTDIIRYLWYNESLPHYLMTFSMNKRNNTSTTTFDTTVIVVNKFEVDVNEYSSSSIKINVYPNPVRDVLTIQFTDLGFDKLSIQVTNVQGQMVLQEQLVNVFAHSSIAIDVSSFEKGMYVLHFISNRDIAVKRFIVQ